MRSTTTLLAAASTAALLAGGARAAEPITASVGGYFDIGAGYVDEADGPGKGAAILREGEIHFNIQGVSDNGLTFRGRVELEAHTDNDDQIDENWVSVSGPFGTVMIGGNDTAKTNFAVGILYGPGDTIGYYDDDAYQGLTGGMDDAGDAMAIHYSTPEFNGFTAGVSYTPDVTADGVNDAEFSVHSGASTEAWAFGARYRTNVMGADLAVAGGYQITPDASATGGDLDTWSLGAEGSHSGFTLAAYYERNEDDSDDYSGGLSYETGPWTFGGGYSLTTGGGAADVHTVAGWTSYALAPGVTAAAGAAYAEQGSRDGLSAMTWMHLAF